MVKVILYTDSGRVHDWPAELPPPHIGENVDTGDYWYIVTDVVWRLDPADPYVTVALMEV